MTMGLPEKEVKNTLILFTIDICISGITVMELCSVTVAIQKAFAPKEHPNTT